MIMLCQFLLLFLTLPLMATSFAGEIYGIPRSGWTSPDWNWGSAMGTGHDAAMICRRTYSTDKARAELVQTLIAGDSKKPDFEEVKLVLALAWQQGRWTGSDGGRGGYGEVLASMAKAQRYEVGKECSKFLVQDMQQRFELLDPSDQELELMQTVIEVVDSDVELAKRRCAGLVLNAMGFVNGGL